MSAPSEPSSLNYEPNPFEQSFASKTRLAEEGRASGAVSGLAAPAQAADDDLALQIHPQAAPAGQPAKDAGPNLVSPQTVLPSDPAFGIYGLPSPAFMLPRVGPLTPQPPFLNTPNQMHMGQLNAMGPLAQMNQMQPQMQPQMQSQMQPQMQLSQPPLGHALYQNRQPYMLGTPYLENFGFGTNSPSILQPVKTSDAQPADPPPVGEDAAASGLFMLSRDPKNLDAKTDGRGPQAPTARGPHVADGLGARALNTRNEADTRQRAPQGSPLSASANVASASRGPDNVPAYASKPGARSQDQQQSEPGHIAKGHSAASSMGSNADSRSGLDEPRSQRPSPTMGMPGEMHLTSRAAPPTSPPAPEYGGGADTRKRAKSKQPDKRAKSSEENIDGSSKSEGNESPSSGTSGGGTEQEKRRIFLERNRIAALKSRLRKKQWVKDLQDKIDGYTKLTDELQAENAKLNRNQEELKRFILSYHDMRMLPPHILEILNYKTLHFDPPAALTRAQLSQSPNSSHSSFGMQFGDFGKDAISVSPSAADVVGVSSVVSESRVPSMSRLPTVPPHLAQSSAPAQPQPQPQPQPQGQQSLPPQNTVGTRSAPDVNMLRVSSASSMANLQPAGALPSIASEPSVADILNTRMPMNAARGGGPRQPQTQNGPYSHLP